MNAEGEKIQLAVERAKCLQELLEINASVACTIEDLMWLEFISYHKLKAILCSDICDFENCEKKNKNNCMQKCKRDSKPTPCEKPRSPDFCGGKDLAKKCTSTLYSG